MKGTKHILQYFLSSVVNSIVNVGFTFFILNGISESALNDYIVLFFLIEIIASLLFFNVDESFNRFYAEGKSDYNLFSNGVFLLITLSFITFCIIIIIPEYNFFGIKIDTYTKLLIFINAVILSFFRILLSYYSSNIVSVSYKNLVVIRSLTLLVLIVLFNSYIQTANGIIELLAISYIPVIIIYSKKFNIKLSHFKFNVIREILIFSYPIVLYTIFSLLADYFTRIYLNDENFETDLAVFNFSFQIYLLVNGVNRVFIKYWQPYSQKEYYKENDVNVEKNNFIYIFSLVIILSIIFFELLNLFDTKIFLIESFKSQTYYVKFLFPMAVFNLIVSLDASFLYFLKKTIKISYINVIANSITIILSYLLAKNYGVLGALVAYIVSILLYGNIFYILTKKYINKSYFRFNKYTVILILYFLSIYYLSSVISIIFLIFLLIFIYRKINFKKIYSI